MRVITWQGERVSTQDSVEVASPPTGEVLRDAYVAAVRDLTLGLVRLERNAVVAGPLTLLRFGEPRVSAGAVEWPIEGGLLARGPGGEWRLASHDGCIQASVRGFSPALPRPLYAITHLQVHLLFTRLYLLRLRGRTPAPGTVPPAQDRLRAGLVDVAFCLTLARMTGRRRLRRTLLITAAYHVACWTTTGRTLGGLVMRQRVVAVDGSRLTPAQALLRFVLLPASWISRRPVHDEIAASEVVRADI